TTKGRRKVNRHINWARRQKIKPASRKNVLFVLSDHANDQNEVWLKLETLCEESGHCRDTVIESLDDLERQWIQDTGKRKGKTLSIKVYRLSGPETPTTKQSEKSDGSSRNFQAKQSEFSGEAVGKDRLLAVGKTGLLHEAKEPKNQTPNPQGT